MKKFICKLFNIKNVYNGILYLSISFSSPWYSKGKGIDVARKVLKINLRNKRLYFAIREKNITSMNGWVAEKINKIFEDKKFNIEGIYVNLFIEGEEHPFPYSIGSIMFMFGKDDWKATDNIGVFFNETKQRYMGFTHRGGCTFGIGDVLFDLDKEDVGLYYTNKKYRTKYLKCLKRYNKKEDDFGFRDAIQDGIAHIVPYKYRGSKIIETLDEAFKAAANMSDYLS